MKIPLHLLFLFLLFPFQLLSQHGAADIHQDKPLRIEIPSKSDKETYRVVPCGKEGVLVFYRSLEQTDEIHTKWYFTWYDQNLQRIWVKSVPLLTDQEFAFQDFRQDTLSLLFVHGGKSKTPMVDFGLLRLLTGKGTFILNMGKIRQDQEVVHFSATSDFAWVGLTSTTGAGQFLFMNLKSGSIRPFSLGEGSALAIRWACPDTINQGINAIVTRVVTKKQTEHYLVRYDTTGVIRSEIPLTTGDAGKEFTHFRALQLPGGKFLVAGSYRHGGSNAKKKEEEVSTGFFGYSVSPGTQKSPWFYNFLDFKNASSLLNEKDLMTLRKKSMKKSKLPGEYSVDFPLMFQDIVQHDGRFILPAEVYSPQYRTESYTDFDFYGRPYTNSYSVFDGFRYQNAIVAGFDSDGRLIWDNVLEIRNLVSFDPSPKVALYFDGNDILLSFLGDGKIGYKIIRADSIVEKLDYVALDLLYPDDKLINESGGRMIKWYENYFLCYGYQEIKNIALTSNNKRMVFYVNKVRFER